VLGTHSARGYRRVPFVGARRKLCAACGMQAGRDGGLVRIGYEGKINVSIVGSTLTGVTVRAHFLSTR
jgi:hypothetical protein